MAQSTIGRPIHWVEPAHPSLVAQYEDTVALYTAIKASVQGKVDAAFDAASSEIGFVVATTVPIAVKVDDKQAAEITVGPLFAGTLLGRKLLPAFDALAQHQTFKAVGKGTYNIYAIWQEALALALRHDWMEPAHVGVVASQIGEEVTAIRRPLPPGVREPAHFLDGRIQLTPEETVLLSAIDKVYPDLHLAARVAAARAATRPVAVSPHVMEPAHYRSSQS